VDVTFAGAAQEVTGSCHLVRVNGRLLALDCGLFQGKRSLAREKNLKLPFTVGELDAVVLSHAHIDHAGRIPFLVRAGYTGRIWATPATRDLCAIMLADSAHIQEKDAEYLSRHGRMVAEPLYGVRHAAQAIEQMLGIPFKTGFEPIPGVRATFVEAGHILGSASVVLDCTEGSVTRRLVFSGDIGRAGLPIIRDPVPPAGAHVVIMESTYGNRDHEPIGDARARLREIVSRTASRGGRILIPAFAVGRTQEIIYELHILVREGAIPSIPVYIDSPLAIDTTSVFEMHPDLFDSREDLVERVNELFRFVPVRYTRDPAESKALNSARGPMIIIAASGMAEAGRILHHLAHGASDPRNTILIVGFQAEHTLGRRIVERRPILRILGEDVPLRAAVEVINGYSAHADRTELMTWLSDVRRTSPDLQRVHLVHGEPEAQQALLASLTASGYSVDAPGPGAMRSF
jgi:metallo-beta-lactamase family protein